MPKDTHMNRNRCHTAAPWGWPSSLRVLLGLSALSAVWAPAGQAQVYKWVDAQGRTHYTATPPPATAHSTGAALHIKTPTLSGQAPSKPAAANEAFKADPKASAGFPPPPVPTPPPRARSNGKDDGSDASRCALAQDILDGHLVHGNGNPIDQHDREVAQADVKRHCGKKR